MPKSIRPLTDDCDATLLGAAPGRFARAALAGALGLALVLLWSLTHRYAGLGGDAELYAFQAMARLHPNLTGDLYLRYGSQDQYTVFSPLYAAMIGALGLPDAALLLTFVFKLAFFTAAWFLARRFAGLSLSFLAVSLLIIVSGRYGAFSVFHYAEDWVTARSPAEALVLAAVAMQVRGHRVGALTVGAAALFLHPLMALPGVLLVLCLSVPRRIALGGAVAGVAATLGLAAYAVLAAKPAGILAVMDPAWLEVVRERSKFLLLQTWSRDDWNITLRPLLSLALLSLALEDAAGRKLCVAALLVGTAGLAVALIASFVGPVAVLLQGQAWRWVWVGACAGLLLVPSGALRLWQSGGPGPLAAALLLTGWTFEAVDEALPIALALLIWTARRPLARTVLRDSRWAAAAVGVVVAASIGANAWSTASAALSPAGHPGSATVLVRDLLKLVPLALLLAAAGLWLVRSLRSTPARATLCAALLATISVALPAAIHHERRVEVVPLAAQLQDWRRVIPPQATVLVVPSPVSPALAWFSLQRPSYLSIDQSSGVVFSSATAEEIRRRSQVVRPVWQSTWRLASRRSRVNGASAPPALGSFEPLTAAALAQMCRDPQLDFVVAREKVGPSAAPAPRSGPWKGWNLYACRRVVGGTPPT